MAEKEGEKTRLGLRIDPRIFDRLDEAVHNLKRAARARGEKLSQEDVVQDAITHYLDFLEHKGDELVASLEEAISIGNDTDRRTLKSCVGQVLQGARARAERKSKTGA